jgi:hypothetical protein
VDNLGSLPLHLKHGILLVQGEEIGEEQELLPGYIEVVPRDSTKSIIKKHREKVEKNVR